MRLERRGSRVGAGAGGGNGGSGAGVRDVGSWPEAEDVGSGAEVEAQALGRRQRHRLWGGDRGHRLWGGGRGHGSEAGGGGFRTGDEGLRPLGRLSMSRGIQNKRLRPLSSSSSSTSSGLDSRSGNPSISRRVGRSSRLGSKGALPSGPFSGLVDIARGVTEPIVMVVPP
jgi:hypothetical protein